MVERQVWCNLKEKRAGLLYANDQNNTGCACSLCGYIVLTSAVTLIRHNLGVFNSGISKYTVSVVYASVSSTGLLYAGITQDFSGAAKWWIGSAKRGNPFSRKMLGGYHALLGDRFGDKNYLSKLC